MRLVISYSTTDVCWRDRLRSFLMPLESGRVFTEIWDRSCISAGHDAASEIVAAFRRADLALVLVSARYLADRMLMDQELQQLFVQRRSRGLPIIPIILSPCLWESVTELNKLAPLPADGRAISQADSLDAALNHVASELHAHAQKWHRRNAPTRVKSPDHEATINFDRADQKTLITANKLLSPAPNVLPKTKILPAPPRRRIEPKVYFTTFKTMATGAFLFDLLKSTIKGLSQFIKELGGFLIKYKVMVTVASTAGAAIVAVDHYQPEQKLAARVGLRPIKYRTTSPPAIRPRATKAAIPAPPPPTAVALPTALPPQYPPQLQLATPNLTAKRSELVLRAVDSAAPVEAPGRSAESPSRSPSKGLSRSPSEGPSRSPSEGPSRGPSRGPLRPHGSGQSASVLAKSASVLAKNDKTIAVLDDKIPLRQSAPKMVPESAVRADVLHEEILQLPFKTKIPKLTQASAKNITLSACQEISGNYKVCLSENGKVSIVEALSGISDADDEIVAHIKKSIYKPQHEPVCFLKRLVYLVGNGCKRKMVSVSEIMRDKTSINDEPRLSNSLRWKLTQGGDVSCSYKVCVDTYGSVTDVETVNSLDAQFAVAGEDKVIINNLKKWQFKPQPYEKCFFQIIEFNVK